MVRLSCSECFEFVFLPLGVLNLLVTYEKLLLDEIFVVFRIIKIQVGLSAEADYLNILGITKT